MALERVSLLLQKKKENRACTEKILYNDTVKHRQDIACLANALTCVEAVEVEPYHPMGRDKARDHGIEYLLPVLDFMDEHTAKAWMESLQAETPIPVRRA